MATIDNQSTEISKPVKRKLTRKLPTQLVLFLLGYRLEVVRYWCTVCSDPPRGLEVSNANVIMAVMEFEQALKWMFGIGWVELRKHLQTSTFRRPLYAADYDEGPRMSRRRSFADAVLKDFGRIESEVDRAVAGRAGWDWYCLGRAIGAYRIELYEYFRRAGSQAPVPEPRGIARAALAIPSSEADRIRSIDQLRSLSGSWTLDQFVSVEDQISELGTAVWEHDPQWVIELWQARLSRELGEAFSDSTRSAAAHDRIVFGFLGLRFDDVRLIAYRDVNGEDAHVDLRQDPRLWLFLKELSRAEGEPLSMEDFCKTRSDNDYADNIEDETFRKDKYRLARQLSPLKLTIKPAGKLAYVLAEAEDRKR